MAVSVEIDDSNEHIVIIADWRYKELCKSIPGSSWNVADKVWRIPLSWTSCLALRSTFRSELEIGPKLTEWATSLMETRITPALSLREAEDFADGDPVLFPHQRAGVEFLATAKRALLADEPGLGKTATTIRALKKLHDDGIDVFPVLIVCPNTLKKNWAREFAIWWPESVVTQVISGSAAQRKKQFSEPAQIFIINWESLRSHSRLAPYGSISLVRCKSCGGLDEKVTEARCEVHLRELNNLNFKSVVADECFTGGVPINTPSGNKKIEDISIGDYVWGFNHATREVVKSKVTDKMTRKSSSIIGGWDSTPNHPFYVVGRGYTAIGDLDRSDSLYVIDTVDMPEMQPRVRSTVLSNTPQEMLLTKMRGGAERLSVGEEHSIEGKNFWRPYGVRMVQKIILTSIQKERQGSILLEDMFKYLHSKHSREKRSYVEGYYKKSSRSEQLIENKNAGEGKFGQKPLQTYEQGSTFSQREKRMAESCIWNEHKSEENLTRSGAAIGNAASTQTGTFSVFRRCRDISKVCIYRYSLYREKISSRGGRWDTQKPETYTNRRSSYSETRGPRMESHPLLELRSHERYEQMCREGYENLGGDEVDVYSITTETGNYFANDVLVRNCHRSKNPSSKQSRALWSASGDAKIRFALTGTPIANNVVDLWAILHWLSPKDWPSKTKWIDRMVDVMLNAFGGMMILGIKPAMSDEFYKSVNPYMRRMLKKVVLPHLPPIMRERRDVEMSTKQKKAYTQMRDLMIAELESGDILTAPGVLTQTIRLLQFASSFATLEVDDITGETKTTLVGPSCKVDALMDDIENGDFGDDSVAVTAVSKQLINLLSAEMTKAKIPHGLITGDQDEDERQRAIDDFQSGKIKWILFTAQAGGVGITLTAARQLVMLQRPWSLVDYKQVMDRVHRIGSEVHDSIVITDYVTDGTIEERVIQVLDTKADNFEQIVRDREQLRKLLIDDKEGNL